MTTCPKCGGKNIIGPRYCSGAVPCPGKGVPDFRFDGRHHAEHLADICATCGYWHARPCLDERKPS